MTQADVGGCRLVRRGSAARGWWVLAGWVALALSRPVFAADVRVDVTLAESIRKEAFSGRVYLFFSAKPQAEPRLGPNWFQPEPFAAIDVESWKPGQVLSFPPRSTDPDSKKPGVTLLSFPRPWQELKLAGHAVQGVARFNPHERAVGTGVGNGYSAKVVLPAEFAADKPISITIDRLVEDRPFPETKWSKLLEIRSDLLSRFHQRDVFLKACVTLPASYETAPERRYPVIFSIPGFSGTHLSGVRQEPVAEKNAEGVEFLRVVLDPSCGYGHHVFADSANNGPVGQALVDELIPALDQRFRTIPEPTARFLTGHSSGGWSSLWLQITYPQVFNGTWSLAPDPVDFRDFQQINLYRPNENMYRDAKGARRPLARTGKSTVRLWYDDFDHMETVLGHGGQLHSFEAVFSPRGRDGKPLLAWNRTTGAVLPDVTKAWEKYDIRLILETRWKTLGPQLQGKLHVIMGDEDTFYLEGATRLLGESLKKLESDAVVEMVPGKDHSNILTPALTQRVRNEMVARFLQFHPTQKGK